MAIFDFLKKTEQKDEGQYTEVRQGIEDLKDWAGKNKKMIYQCAIGDAIASLFAAGWLYQSWQQLGGKRESVNIFSMFFDGLFKVLPLSMVVFLVFGYIIYRYLTAIKKDYVHDKKGNYDRDLRNIYGSGHKQTESERNECFYRAKDPLSIPKNLDILGIDDDGMLYALRDDLVGLNKHMAVIGSSGSGKSAGLVFNQIFQNILRGDSCIVTDCKGDLYSKAAKLAKKYGYTVKILNLKSSELKNSDGCDFLKTLGEDDVKATELANTIIINTMDGARKDYFANNEMNYLKALLLLISNDPARIKTHTNTLAELYNFSTMNDLGTITQIINMLPNTHPAKSAFNIFLQCEPKIQGQIANGMNIRLQVLSNKWAQRLVSEDEIDLVAPMKKKCMYFVVISDTDTSFKFIATLFFAELFKELCDYYDGRSAAKKKQCKTVNFILDEYANTGAIPEMDIKIAAIRSRGLNITMIIQDINQLEKMYPNNVLYTILNNVSVKMCLASSDPATLKYLSDLTGTETVRMTNRRYSQASGDIIRSHANYTVTEGVGKRNVYTTDEISAMPSTDLILVISGHQPLDLHKYIYTNHPMAKEMEESNPRKHIPKWRVPEYMAEKKKKELQKERDESFKTVMIGNDEVDTFTGEVIKHSVVPEDIQQGTGNSDNAVNSMNTEVEDLQTAEETAPLFEEPEMSEGSYEDSGDPGIFDSLSESDDQEISDQQPQKGSGTGSKTDQWQKMQEAAPVFGSTDKNMEVNPLLNIAFTEVDANEEKSEVDEYFD